MEIHNKLPLLLSCLKRWERLPSAAEFSAEYARPMAEMSGGFFDDFHSYISGLDWKSYRNEALKIDPQAEEKRVRDNLGAVENLFGFKLEGEILILGAFTAMDGYARFDRGSHRVFLGVDESHADGKYLDVLISHELTHVARESRPEVWEGWGLNPKMTQSEFTEYQPVVEHLMGEGFSCAVSEILHPKEKKWHYAYQTEDSLEEVYSNSKRIDQVIHQELKKPDGDYGRLYRLSPDFAHYVWAWQWAKSVLEHLAENNPRKLVSRCTKDLVEDALSFRLSKPV